jgi:signal transduction histidine kinase
VDRHAVRDPIRRCGSAHRITMGGGRRCGFSRGAPIVISQAAVARLKQHRIASWIHGPVAVWVLSTATLAIALWFTFLVRRLGPLNTIAAGEGFTLQWWMLAPAFALAEAAVVHLKFRKDAHSFSMSEIPLVLGLFFAAPVHLVVGQLVGNLVILTFGRKQRAIKLAFNIAQFALQTTVAVVIFRAIAGSSGFRPIGWLAAYVAAFAALFVADALINAAITFTGGAISRRDVLGVFGVSVMAAFMNTSLGLTAATVLNYDPAATWLALVSPVILYVAYRAYVAQQRERGRLESLFEMTRELHRRPQLEGALVSAATHARSMVEAEYVELVLMPTTSDAKVLVTRSGPGTESTVLQAAVLTDRHPAFGWDSTGRILTEGGMPGLTSESPSLEIEEGIAAWLERNNETIGIIWAVNKLGDIGNFTEEDRRLLVSIAQQTMVSVENSQLEDSLAQVTELKEQLEGLIRSKDDFLAAVSHELRTPLTAVVGLAHELRDAGMGDESGEFIDIIAEQSGELANLVEDLLTAARADTGNLQVNPEHLDAATEIELALGGVRADARDVPVRVDGRVRVWADPVRLRQILRNLVTNAHRYGGRNGEISVRLVDGMAEIVVSDDGDGVPAGLEETIFARYERGSTVAQPGSVGIGLAVSRELAELMDGNLQYERRLGWTHFVVRLPSAPG